MFKLYVLWVAIYQGPVLLWSGIKGGLQGLLQAFLDTAQIVLLGYGHLWYLLAAAFATALVGLLLWRGLSLRQLLCLGGVLYILGLLGDSYHGLLRPLQSCQPLWTFLEAYGTIFLNTRNGLFEGTIFVAIGACFALRKISLNRAVVLWGLGLSLLLVFFEAWFTRAFSLAGNRNYYLSLVPCAFFLFYLLTHIRVEIPGNRLLRKASALIYYDHLWIQFPVQSVVVLLYQRLSGNALSFSALQTFVFVLLGSLLATGLILWLEQWRAFRWLKQLH